MIIRYHAKKDVEGFVLEGQARIAFEDGRMHLISTADPELGQAANYVFWCPENFPADVEITWEFQPLNDVGLCIFFFAALGKNGEDIFDEHLAKHNGPYDLYHHGDINVFHISYYRRRYPEERVFRTCNLRKSYGFHLTAIAGDPIPELASATKAYQMKVVKRPMWWTSSLTICPSSTLRTTAKPTASCCRAARSVSAK